MCISKDITLKALNISNTIANKCNNFKGKNLKGICAAIIYIACKNNLNPVSH